MKLHFKILSEPTAKQSFRFAVRKGKNDKTFVSKYQPKEVVQKGKNLSWDIKSQVPEGFVPFDCPLKVEVLFVFPAPASWSKKKMAELTAGKVIYKDTKPDLDNLEKQNFDCMAGIVFTNDSRIVVKSTQKIYGLIPRTEITIEPVDSIPVIHIPYQAHSQPEAEGSTGPITTYTRPNNPEIDKDNNDVYKAESTLTRMSDEELGNWQEFHSQILNKK